MEDLMSNKKGASITTSIIILVVAVILTIILGIYFIASNAFKFYVIGGIILFYALFFGFKDGLTREKTPVFAIALIIGAGFIFLPALGVIQTAIPSGTYVQAPTFYYYECAPASQPVESSHTTLTTGSSNGWITCPANTDTCDLWISQTETLKWYSTDRRLVYQICHNNKASCDSQVFSSTNVWNLYQSSTIKAPTIHISNLLSTDSVYVNYQSSNILLQWSDKPNGAEWYQTYKPFVLWKVDMFGGGRTQYTTDSQGCNFPAGDINKLINSVTNSAKQISSQSSTSNTYLPFYKTRNFIGTYVPIATANVNFVTYNGQQGYCLNRQIFAITTVTTNGGTYQIVDNNFNTRLASSVTCCPGETQPNQKCKSDFTWETLSTTPNQPSAQCSAFNACAGADWQDSSSKTQVRYNCVNSKCVAETRTVECVYNSDCGVNNQCDSYLHKCIIVEPGVVIPNNTATNAPTCNWYETYLVKSDTSYAWYDVLHISPKTTTTSGCYTNSIVYVLIFGAVIILVLIVVIVYSLPKKGRNKKIVRRKTK